MQTLGKYLKSIQWLLNMRVMLSSISVLAQRKFDIYLLSMPLHTKERRDESFGK